MNATSLPEDTEHLVLVKPAVGVLANMVVLVVAHNERNILPCFFRHYRSLGCFHFVFVDDRSSDGSLAWLERQHDVTIYRPRDGSYYSNDKVKWRKELLDELADDRWCIVVDADEHFVWQQCASKSILRLVNELDHNDFDALPCAMVDMYKDSTVRGQKFMGSSLFEEYPYFDDPRKDQLAYIMRMPGSSFSRKFPSPSMIISGGMRQRLFGAQAEKKSWVKKKLLGGSIYNDINPNGLEKLINRLIYLLTAFSSKKENYLNCTKVPLIRWKKGYFFNGGAHHISQKLKLPKEKGVILHYPLTKGEDGVNYIVQRSQHSAGSKYYRLLETFWDINPLYFGSSRASSAQDVLDAFIK